MDERELWAEIVKDQLEESEYAYERIRRDYDERYDEIEDLRYERREEERMRREAEDDLALARDEIAALREQNMNLISENKEAAKDIEEITRTNSVLSGNVSKLEQLNNRLRKEVGELIVELERLRRECR